MGEYRGLRTVEHSGGDPGYAANLVRFPDQGIAIALLCNRDDIDLVGLTHGVADIYLADKFPAADPKPAAVERVPVKVDPKIFDAYVGSYRFPEGLMVTITKENDRLWGQPAGSSKAELFPESETKFFARITDAQVSFQRDEKGAVTQMTLHQNGKDLIGKRAEPVSFSAEKLREYASEYYSDELGTTYTIVAQGDGLVAQHRRHSDISLKPIDADLFSGGQWFFQRVRFTRDKEGRVSGFRLTGSRVRNMRFEKGKVAGSTSTN